MSRCAWIDSDGVRCPAIGVTSHRLDGTKRVCPAHARCTTAADGRAVIDRYVLDGQAAALDDRERARVLARLEAGPALDVPKLKARRHAQVCERAAAIYDEVRRGYRAAGVSETQAHIEALAKVYEAGRGALHQARPARLVGADYRAGEGLER